MRALIALPLLGLSAIIQSTLMPSGSIPIFHPDLVLLVVVAWGLLQGHPEALAWGLIGGLFLDLLSGLPFGASLLPMIVVASLAGAGGVGIFGQHVSVPLVGSLVATVVYYAVSLLILAFLDRPFPLGTFVLRYLLPVSLANVMTMILVFPVVRWIHRLTLRQRIDL